MNQHFIHLLYSYYFLLLSYQALLGYCTRYYYYENILTIQSKLLFLTLCEKTAVQFSTICKVCVDVAGSSPQKSRIHFCLWTSSCSPVSVLSPLSILPYCSWCVLQRLESEYQFLMKFRPIKSFSKGKHSS